MGRLHVTQIENRLKQTVMPHVSVTDLDAHGQAERDQARLSRSLAAFVVMKQAGVTADVAAGSVTDEPGDNGIDAAIAIPSEQRVVLIQSKWASNSTGSAAKADIVKFREGVDDLVSGKWENFGGKLVAKRPEIEPMLMDTRVKIELIFAHLGTGEISPECHKVMTDYLEDMNDPSEFASFAYFNQGGIHRLLVEESGHQKIDLDVELSDWGTLESDPPAFYGHVKGEQVADWYGKCGATLLAKNVRVVIPDSEVNQGLGQTLRDHPDHFWYYNNGITMLCDRFVKAPAGGTDRRVGHFRAEGASIVNGAQTTGSVFKAQQQGLDLSAVRIMVRFISLEGAAAEFANEVTRATNTQNRIGGREFVSLDPEQQRLKDEFAVEGLVYVFRTGETSPEHADGCDVIDATIALACAHSAQLATQAKREISRLWEDINKPPYKLIFNRTTSYLKVWRAVRAMRIVDSELKSAITTLDGRERLIATHGNRALLHLLLRQVDLRSIDNPDCDWQEQLDSIARKFADTLGLMTDIVSSDYPGYPASLFKNATKVQELTAKVLAKLPSTPPEGT